MHDVKSTSVTCKNPGADICGPMTQAVQRDLGLALAKPSTRYSRSRGLEQIARIARVGTRGATDNTF